MGKARRFTVVLVMVTMLVIAAPAAFAAKGGGGKGHGTTTGGSGTFSFVMVSDTNANGLANYGDSVTASVVTTIAQPWVQLTCYQNGTTVLNQYIGFYAGYPWSQVFSLGTWMWTSGAADCNARFFDGSNNATLATTSFHVDA